MADPAGEWKFRLAAAYRETEALRFELAAREAAALEAETAALEAKLADAEAEIRSCPRTWCRRRSSASASGMFYMASVSACGVTSSRSPSMTWTRALARLSADM